MQYIITEKQSNQINTRYEETKKMTQRQASDTKPTDESFISTRFYIFI